MSSEDRQVMSQALGLAPWRIDAYGLSLCRRPRLYWVSWELREAPGASFQQTEEVREVVFHGHIQKDAFLESGWTMVGESLPTFTTSRPQQTAGRKPAGLGQCQAHELLRWENDSFRFPPYQYRDVFCVKNAKGNMRLPNVAEREVLMGFPSAYTKACMGNPSKGQQSALTHA